MKIHHKTGFTLGVLAIIIAVVVIGMWLAGITGSSTTATISLTTIVVGSLCIYWSTSDEHRERLQR